MNELVHFYGAPMHRFLALLPLAAGLTLASAAPATAATFNVVTVADAADSNSGDGICSASSAGNQCTLRAAIGQAQFTPGADKIVLGAGTYQLLDGLGQLSVTSSVTIEGAGARTTTIRAAADSRVMAASGNLILRDVGITGGSPKSTSGIRGGGITVTAGDATLERVAIYNNTVTSASNAWGGGIAADGGSLEIIDSTISGNTAVGRLDASTGGNATGGGVAIASPTIIRRSTISGNVTRGFNAGSFSTGGGVAASDETTLEHVTIAGNVASTVADSSGFKQGGNLYVQGTGQRILAGVILAGGAANNGPDCYVASGTVTETARNLSSTADCLGAGSIRNAAVQLGALGNNGGPTDTIRPAAGSPAINAATNCGTRTADQRGAKLPAGAGCDLGAVEVGGDRKVTLQSSATAPAAGDVITLIATITNDGPDATTGETFTIELPDSAIALTATSTIGTCTVGATAVCTVGALASGMTATILATVKASGAAGTLLAKRAGSLPDPTAANDTAVVALTAGPTVPGGGGGGAGGGNGDQPGGGQQPPAVTPAPEVTGLKLPKKATLKKGAELQFTLSAPATVKIVTERLLPGRLKAGTCKAGLKKGKKCTAAKVLDTRTVALPAGAAKVRLPKGKLRAGKVRFTLTPTAAGGATGKPQTLIATVRKR